jgi:hypothetical protein
MTSGNNNWMKLFTTSNAAGKTIEKVELSIATPSATNLQFGAFVVDDQIVTSLNTDTDSFIDSPTNGTQTDTGAGGEVSGNYATWNQLIVTTNNTLSQGNLQASHAASTGWSGNSQQSNSSMFVGNMGMSSGKWYWEIAIDSATDSSIGIVNRPGGHSNYVGYPVNGIAEGWGWAAGGTIYHTSGITNDGGTLNTYAVNGTSILGFALDMDNGRLYVSNNGAYENSGDPEQETGYCASGMSGTYYFAASQLGSNSTWTGTVNTGQRPFAYTAPSGYKALCTANLPDPTIADGSTAMDATLYTGDGSTQIIDGLNFSPDLVWIKARDSNTSYHVWFDRVRGEHLVLRSENNVVEADYDPNGVSAFGTDSFSVTDDSTGGYSVNGPPGGTYSGNGTYVAWTWDAGSSTVSNTDGTITSSVRANPSAGFSIVSYTGTGTAGTVGHGLNAAPQMILVKNRDAAIDGRVYHVGTDAANPRLYWIKLFASAGNGARQTTGAVWNDTAPTETVFSLGTASNVNSLNQEHIAYCWTPVEGYSAFGSYTGNGLADGPFVYTGFRPRFLLYKYSSTTGNWAMFDSERNTYNVMDNYLLANTSDAEASLSAIDFLSNGFKVRTAQTSGTTVIYAAFAENPFKTARAR